MLRSGAESDHDRMVEHTARHLRRRFYRDIRARADGFPSPETISNGLQGAGQVPDVTAAAHGGSHHLFEVETADSISHAATGDKWSLFADNAAQHKVDFWIVVPRGTRGHAEKKLSSLKLKAKVWEI